MIDARDILNILNDMAKRSESTDLMGYVYDRLAEGITDLSQDIQTKALEIIAGQKRLEKEIFDKDVQKYLLSITGTIGMNEVVSFFDVRGEQKRRIYDVIRQMEKDGLIIRTGVRHGTYRLVDLNPHIMDLSSPSLDPVKIKLPFFLHDLVVLYPKNIILISGEKDAGKTAFVLNAAWMNRDRMPVVYFNSEMGLEELRARLALFNYPKDEWSKITWMEQAKQFEDHIDPNGLNIIDFLEVGKEAFTVTEDIRRVFDKLDHGLLLIVMQKRSYKEYAVGGEGTLEKARLAVNLEHKDGENICRITVAKNWRGVENPRGKVCKYKVFSGGVMKMSDYWSHPEKSEASPSKSPKGFTKKKRYPLNSTEDEDFPRE